MPITREVQETVATVEISDDYGVELRQLANLTAYTPAEAIALAEELVRVAGDALAARATDEAAWGLGTMTRDEAMVAPGFGRPSHGFDVAPVCRECSEGKHGACNGQALVDTEHGDVSIQTCGCFTAAHVVIGGAA